MPYQLDTPVLTVDTRIMDKVDAANPQNLFSMWTVFSKCADSVQNGRRLEYMCWRYWNKATIQNLGLETTTTPTATTTTTTSTTTGPKAIASIASMPEVPHLSKSVDSVQDEEAVEFTPRSSPVDIRPRILRQDSCASRRDRVPRSDEFEKLFVSIIKEQETLVPPPSPPRQASAPADFHRSGSTTTDTSEKTSEEAVSDLSEQPTPEVSSFRTTTVIRGFSPAMVTVEQPSSPMSSLGSSSASASPQLVHKQTTFVRGAPGSSSEQQNIGARKPVLKSRQPARFQIGASASSEDDGSPRGQLQKSRSVAFLGAKKQLTLQQQSSRAMMSSAAVIDDSETEGDDVDESAIDDDEDDSDWEDSDEASGKSSIDDKTYFKRIDSSTQLVSRRSLLTLGLAATDRQARLGNAASRSTSALHRTRSLHAGQPVMGSPNDSDEAPLMMKTTNRAGQLKPIKEAPRSVAQPILAQANQGHFQAALSPRTTRRNMLSTELTESLRRHLLWERQQKSSTANAVLKRRHTSHDVANLKQYPEKPYMNKADDANSSSWNQYFSKEASNGYHSKGW